MDIPLVNQTVEMMNPVVQQEQVQQNLLKTISDNSFAQTWGSLYQTESDPKKIESFLSHNNVPIKNAVVKSLDKALKVFKGDKGIEDQANLRELLIRTAKHESLGGEYLEQLSGGPGRGAWQVEPETARDIIKTSGLIGKKAEKVLGKTKKQILDMSDKEISTFLKKHDVNAVFATAKYLQAADAKDQLDALR